jgi:hypothetical protein
MMEWWKNSGTARFHSIIPVFHYSNVPVFRLVF